MRRFLVIGAVIGAVIACVAGVWLSGYIQYNQARTEFDHRCRDLQAQLSSPAAQAVFEPAIADGNRAEQLEQAYKAASPGDARQAIAKQYAATIDDAVRHIDAYEHVYRPYAVAVKQAMDTLKAIDGVRYDADEGAMLKEIGDSMQVLRPLDNVVDRVSAVLVITTRAVTAYQDEHHNVVGFDDDAETLKAVTTVLDQAAGN